MASQIMALALVLGIATVDASSLPVQVGELEIWQKLYNALGGDSWTVCSGQEYFENPCSCDVGANKKVTCIEDNGKLRIQKIKLGGMNLVGTLDSTMLDFRNLDELVLINNPDLTFLEGDCIDIPVCYESPAKCSVDSQAFFCYAKVWTEFFNYFGGPRWKKCTTKGTDPCSCAWLERVKEVQCLAGKVPTKIYLSNNDLVLDGETAFPVQLVEQMKIYGLTRLDLSDNPGIIGKPGCVHMPFCDGETLTCILPENTILCHETAAPTTGVPSYMPTAAPTTLQPTLAPTRFDKCEEINALANTNTRQNVCEKNIPECEFNDSTDQCKQAVPTIPSPTMEPTPFSCEDFNSIEDLNIRENKCDKNDDLCRWENNECVSKPTKAPTLISDINCLSYNDFNRKTARTLCKKYNEVCKWKDKTCITRPPFSCEKFNKWDNPKKRKRKCNKYPDECDYDRENKQCITKATSSPTTSSG